MRLHRKHYAIMIFLLALLGSVSIAGSYPMLLGAGFFVALLLLFGGLLRESDSKVVEGTEAEADEPPATTHARPLR